uniref:Probable DNA polymerase n=1 Tax=Phanerochaete carnosa TaxID=231932 RepID=A0A895KUE4_9APHY|nr:DNA polymerase [Phanerochaete carnosa]QRZ60399.1 DNA polymerase [Phanerochaete carnosa]
MRLYGVYIILLKPEKPWRKQDMVGDVLMLSNIYSWEPPKSIKGNNTIKFLNMQICNKTYELPQSTPITKDVISGCVTMFWEDVYKTLYINNNNIHLLLMCKVEFTDKSVGYKTLADMRKVNWSDREAFEDYLINRLGLLSDSYAVDPVDKIIFTYIVKDGIADDSRSLLHVPKYEVKAHSYNNMVLPLTMDPTKYGEVRATQVLNDKVTRYIVINSANYTFEIDVSENINNVHILGAADLKWVDTKLSDNTFKRVIGINTLYIKDGVVVVKEKQLSAKPFYKVGTDKKLAPINNFMTIDIESVNIDDHQTPYLICGYTNDKYIYSYASDTSLEAQAEMFNQFIKQMLAFKSVKYIYAHNLSGFDGILILKHLIKYDGAKVDPLLFNGKLMAIAFKIGGRTIRFKDSYLLLPMSLRVLCKSFGIDTIKSHFPFNLSDINYTGEFPGFEYWTDISLMEYNSIYSSHSGDWSFKDEAVKYCKLDCSLGFNFLDWGVIGSWLIGSDCWLFFSGAGVLSTSSLCFGESKLATVGAFSCGAGWWAGWGVGVSTLCLIPSPCTLFLTASLVSASLTWSDQTFVVSCDSSLRGISPSFSNLFFIDSYLILSR